MDQFPSLISCPRLPGVTQTPTSPNPFMVQFGPSSSFSLPSRRTFGPQHVLVHFSVLFANDQSVDSFSHDYYLCLLMRLPSLIHFTGQCKKEQQYEQQKTELSTTTRRRVLSMVCSFPRVVHRMPKEATHRSNRNINATMTDCRCCCCCWSGCHSLAHSHFFTSVDWPLLCIKYCQKCIATSLRETHDCFEIGERDFYSWDPCPMVMVCPVVDFSCLSCLSV